MPSGLIATNGASPSVLDTSEEEENVVLNCLHGERLSRDAVALDSANSAKLKSEKVASAKEREKERLDLIAKEWKEKRAEGERRERASE